MKKGAAPAAVGSSKSANGAPVGSVLVAAFGSLPAAESAAADLAGDYEIVGTGLRAVPADRPGAGRLGLSMLGGLVVGALVGAVATALGGSPAGLLGCLVLGALLGVAGSVRRSRPAPGSVLVSRYELRAPADVADALRDRVRTVSPAGLVELGSAAPRSALRPAPLGALDSRVRTADEALGLTSR
jgi:hypothetical protein